MQCRYHPYRQKAWSAIAVHFTLPSNCICSNRSGYKMPQVWLHWSAVPCRDWEESLTGAALIFHEKKNLKENYIKNIFHMTSLKKFYSGLAYLFILLFLQQEESSFIRKAVREKNSVGIKPAKKKCRHSVMPWNKVKFTPCFPHPKHKVCAKTNLAA